MLLPTAPVRGEPVERENVTPPASRNSIIARTLQSWSWSSRETNEVTREFQARAYLRS